ncbi:site-specific DNA-methyltransferase [Dehalobacterium formicoaceticum]|uniref:site-specific DNA-methyltransferase n=1 Tax=Dehalobacterium formicoaceticum TaxID=51515 RepID=UPI000B7D6E05|nr:site-specific DNA-methyltransferase [Dehalobacterium formicoaceticum]
MDKMKFETPNLTAENVAKIAELFPGAVTEGKVNIDLLRTMLGEDIFGDEAYEFTWVGKRAAIAETGRPIRKTLRPCMEESKDWDTTENLYIEGDNLDVLKLLQESYLGKVKMIYIDPPYNTGKDSFIYRDKHIMTEDEYEEAVEVYDDDGLRNFKENNTANPRYHSAWCSSIYPTLLLSRNLMSNDGVIFVSIDDNEAHNLRKICDEVFGSENLIDVFYIQVRYASKSLNEKDDFQKLIEQVLVYAKSKSDFVPNKPFEEYDVGKFRNEIVEDAQGETIVLGGKTVTIFKPGQYRIIQHSEGRIGLLKDTWASGSVLTGNTSGKFFDKYLGTRKDIDGIGCLYKVEGIGEDGIGYRYFTGPKKESATKGQFYSGVPLTRVEELNAGSSRKYKPIVNFYDMSGDFGNIRHEGGVDFRAGKKPTKMIRQFLDIVGDKNCLVLDFFSGSASTAHAVMLQNYDDGGKRKFVMVQLPEPVEDSEFTTICEIGKERIRRAGDKIKAEAGLTALNLDIGFRVLKLDDTNMNDVYYAAGDYTQDMISMLQSNIKEDRTDMDLLFGCLLDWGLPLSLPHTHEKIEGFTVHTYNEGDLIACFEERITEKVIREIASRQPLRVVFRDSSFTSSPEKINVVEIFKLLAPNTTVRVI